MLTKFDRVIYVTPQGTYKTIQSGVNAAAAIGTDANPAVVVIAPGTYVENVILASYVWLTTVATFGNSSNSLNTPTVISGNVSWTPTGATNEHSGITDIRITGTLTVDSTGKTGGVMGFFRQLCRVTGVTTFTGRSFLTDVCNERLADGGSIVVTSIVYAAIGGSITAFTANGDAVCTITGARRSSTTVTINGTASYSQDSGTIVGAVTNNSTAVVDLRGARWTTLAGAGVINRNQFNLLAQVVAAGANAFVFAQPYPDANYTVQCSQTAGVAAFPPIIAPKAGAGFTLTSAGAATYDITILHD